MNDGNPLREDAWPGAAPLARVAALEEQLKARTAELERDRAERQELERRLASSEEQSRRQLADMQACYDNAPVGLFVVDTELRYQRINAYLAGLNGQLAAAHLGRTVREMVPGLADQLDPLYRQVLQTGTPVLNVEISGDVANPAGGQRAWRAHFYPQRNPSGAIVGLAGMVEEVTALKQAERELRASEQRYRDLSADLERQVAARTAEIRAAQDALRESEARYRSIFDSVIDAIFIMDLEGNFLAVNEHACQRYGYSREEFLRLHISALNTPEDAVHVPARQAAVKRDGQAVFEAHHQDAQGQPLTVEVRARQILYDGRPAMLSVVRDVTERKRAQERAEYLAYHDALTGLPNRVQGVDRLANMVAQARRHPHQLAVICLDLDQFKHINDRHGHLMGDRLLQSVSRRLAQQVRAEDSFCRLAADEFMLVLSEVGQDHSQAELASLCDRLLTLMAEPFDLDGHQVSVGLSLGVALYPRDGTDGETLMRNADTALYMAKRAGRQTYRFFEPGMNRELARFIQTRDALRLALERQEFVLQYQPQVALDTGGVVGVEALLRWQRPDVGLVMPCDFIDVAEKSGLIVPIGRWVLEEACRQAAAWRAAGWPDLVMAVNLSAVQFRRGGIGDEVLEALEASGLDPAGLALELTESILLQDAEAVLATVATWKAAGIQLAIDDFGTGYSSLAYLKRFQVDKLKIDRSFIVGMVEHEPDRAIVQAILDMAGGLKLRTIAEGVEDATLARQLRLMGCDEAQGYLYSPPLAATDLERWVSRGRG
mgnify:CR=1 FL=1